METSVKITSIIVGAVLFLAVLGFWAYSAYNPSMGKTVTVTGSASVKAVPDIIGVYFNIESNAKTSSEAHTKNTDILNKLTESLLKQGFERSQIVTESFSINPDYDWVNGNRVDKGYKAIHILKIEIPSNRNDKVAGVIDSGVEAGALVSSLNFELSLSKQNEKKAEAMKFAAEDAKLKAEAVASGLGKSIGEVISTSNLDYGYSPWMLYQSDVAKSAVENTALAKQTAVNIYPGEREITANLQVIYKLK